MASFQHDLYVYSFIRHVAVPCLSVLWRGAGEWVTASMRYHIVVARCVADPAFSGLRAQGADFTVRDSIVPPVSQLRAPTQDRRWKHASG